MAGELPTLHASAVLLGRRAVLIRGPSGVGKSRLALGLLQAAEAGLLRFARLVGDDRILVAAQRGSLLVRPAPALAGLIEVRGLGIRRVPFEAVAVAGLVIDLGGAADRLPDAVDREAVILGLPLPRLAVGHDSDALSLALALWHTVESGPAEGHSAPPSATPAPLGVHA